MIDTRFVIFTVNFCFGGETTEVFKPLIIHSEQCDVITHLIMCGILIGAISSRHIGLESENWLNTRRLAFLIKFDQARHGTVVGDRHGLHAGFFDILNEIWNLGQTIKKWIMRVIMQMHKIRRSQDMVRWIYFFAKLQKIVVICLGRWRGLCGRRHLLLSIVG